MTPKTNYEDENKMVTQLL